MHQDLGLAKTLESHLGTFAVAFGAFAFAFGGASGATAEPAEALTEAPVEGPTEGPTRVIAAPSGTSRGFTARFWYQWSAEVLVPL